MSLSTEGLDAHLARGVVSVYVVAGEEPLLIIEAADAIRTRARALGFDEREVLDVPTAREFNWNELTQAYASGSLFSPRRIIELRMSGGPGLEGGAALTEIAQKPNPDVLLLVTTGPLDFRARKGGWFLALEQAGAGVYLSAVDRGHLEPWLRRRAAALGLALGDEALQFLADRTEGNLLAAAQEIRKLALLTAEGVIDAAGVEQVVGDHARFEAFDWLDQVLGGDPAAAARALHRLREEGESVQALTGAFASDLRKLVQAEAAGRGDPARGLASIRFFPARKSAYFRALSRLRAPQLNAALDRLSQIDRLSKRSGGEPAAWEELLVLGSKLSGASRSRDVTAS